MLDGIKDFLRDRLERMDSPVLSIAPQTKGNELSFDAVSAGIFARNGYPRIAAALMGGMPAWSGEPVSNSSALALSTVWACNKIISESVGFLGLAMRQKKGQTSEPAESHPMYGGLLRMPNQEITAQNFTELLTSHCVMQGGSFAQIIRRSGTGTAVELHPLLPSNVTVERDSLKRLVYIVKEANQPDQTYTLMRGKPHDLLHIRGLGWNGLQGYSVVGMARQSIGTAIAQERNVASFYANGGRVQVCFRSTVCLVSWPRPVRFCDCAAC